MTEPRNKPMSTMFQRATSYLTMIEAIGELCMPTERDPLAVAEFKLMILKFISDEMKRIQ